MLKSRWRSSYCFRYILLNCWKYLTRKFSIIHWIVFVQRSVEFSNRITKKNSFRRHLFIIISTSLLINSLKIAHELNGMIHNFFIAGIMRIKMSMCFRFYLIQFFFSSFQVYSVLILIQRRAFIVVSTER